MAKRLQRQNAKALPWVRALLFAGITAIALFGTGFFPTTIAVGLALATGALAAYSAPLASMLLVVVVGIPVIAVDFVVGVLFFVVGFGATQYLGDHEARGFVVVALAAVAVAVHAEWAVVVLAGYVLGSGQGAVAAALSCILIELAGILLGRPAIGTVLTGGTAPGIIAFTDLPADPMSFSWVADSFAAIDTARVIDTLTSAKDLLVLGIQAALWGGAAAVSGLLRKPDRSNKFIPVAGAAAAVAALAVASGIALGMVGTDISMGDIALTGVVSLVIAAGVVAVMEWFFPLVTPKPTKADRGMQAEDADVDELLSAIASAEEVLATRHTTDAVVLITDMKSFSAMTEDIGSMQSAKLVQRHRDLLLPVIEANGGSGKSTGGDGLVAAFDLPTSAVKAACEMQRTLSESSLGKATISIRIGIARGEVVLDKSGRPFIGAALNLAARVMDLADGGRIMAEESVAVDSDPGIVHDHGLYLLKNIQNPTHVYEVLWQDGMFPGHLRGEKVD